MFHKFFFGFDHSDLTNLQKQLTNLSELSNNLSKKDTNISENLASLSEELSERITGLSEQYTDLSEEVTKFSGNFTDLSEELLKKITELSEQYTGLSETVTKFSEELLKTVMNSDKTMVICIVASSIAVTALTCFIAFCIYQGVKHERKEKNGASFNGDKYLKNLINLDNENDFLSNISQSNFITN